jgi:hypothetical protein
MTNSRNPVETDSTTSSQSATSLNCSYATKDIEELALQHLKHTGRPINPRRLRQHRARQRARISEKLAGGQALTIEFLDRQLLSLNMNEYWHPRRGQTDRRKAIEMGYRRLGTGSRARFHALQRSQR